MFGNGNKPYILKLRENEFLKCINEFGSIEIVENISAANEFDDLTIESYEENGIQCVDEENKVYAWSDGTELEKVYIYSLEWLLARNIEDLEALKDRDEFYNTIIEEIIKLENLIPKLQEMIAERDTAARKKFIDENPEYVIHVSNANRLIGYVEDIIRLNKVDDKVNKNTYKINTTNVPMKAKVFTKEDIEKYMDIALALYPVDEYRVEKINIYEKRNLIGIKKHQ